MKTTIIYTKQESSSLAAAGNGMSGYSVTITITEADNISPKIFIMQREVVSSEDEVFLDKFYDVASASMMTTVEESPTLDEPFYRTNAITLIFPNPEDLRHYVAQIEARISLLRVANDALINLQSSQKLATPADTLVRYWGMAPTHAATDETLEAGPKDFVWSKILSKSLTNSAGPRYFYVAIRADLADIATLVINGVSRAFTKTVRDVTNENGYVTSYKIFLTDANVSGSSFTLVTT